MVLCTQIKGNDLIKQKQKLPFKIIRKKIRKTERKQTGDEPFQSAGGLYIMKIRTANDIKEFNAALSKCTKDVWLMGPNEEAFNMKNEEEYIEGIIRLTEGHDDQLGIFTTSREDEMTMMNFLEKMAA
jgi:hypothetical protein